MAITKTERSASVGTSEYFVFSNSTSATYQTTTQFVGARIGLENMAAGDQYQVVVYEKAHASAARRAQATYILTGVTEDLNIPSMPLGVSYEIGIKKIAGTDRTIYASYFTVA